MKLRLAIGVVVLVVALVPSGAMSQERKPADHNDRAVANGARSAKRPVRVTISKETTWITEPLREDGYPDYVQYIDKKLGSGVTPANNALVLLWQIMDPARTVVRNREEFVRRLGVPVVENSENTFVDWIDSFGIPPKSLNPGIPSISDLLQKRYDRAMERPWVFDDDPEMARWLERNDKPLDLLVQASKRSKYYCPTAFRDGSLEIGTRVQRFARALAIRAMLNIGEDKPEKAWDDVIAIYRLGRLIAQGPTLVDLLMGEAIEGIGRPAATEVFASGKLTSEKLRGVQADLKSLPPRSKVADRIDIGERLYFCEAVCSNARLGLDLAEDKRGIALAEQAGLPALVCAIVTDWDVPLREGNHWYDEVVLAMTATTRSQRNTRMAKLEERLVEVRKWNESPPQIIDVLFGLKPWVTNRMSGLVVLEMLPDFRNAASIEGRSDAYVLLVEFALALEQYRAANNRFPMRLSDLSPKYVASLPNDPYSDQPFVYKTTKAGYMLYSVGENGEDDGGSTPDAGARSDDLVIEVP